MNKVFYIIYYINLIATNLLNQLESRIEASKISHFPLSIDHDLEEINLNDDCDEDLSTLENEIQHDLNIDSNPATG